MRPFCPKLQTGVWTKYIQNPKPNQPKQQLKQRYNQVLSEKLKN